MVVDDRLKGVIKMDNPLGSLTQIYEEFVQKADEEGHAEDFKKATDLFFEGMKVYFKEYDLGEVNPTVKYLDGYYIFGMGTNSVVHYWLDRCPDWKFGIWWNFNKEANCVSGEFFAQYEKEIDKFKPSRSQFYDEEFIRFDLNPGTQTAFKFYRMIEFIIRQPELAFCRDYFGWNYNFEYHTKGEAIEKFQFVKKRRELEEQLRKEYDEVLLKFFDEKICPLFTDSKIIDRGDSWSPRYQFCVPLESNQDLFEETGCYDLFDEADPEILVFKEEFENICKEYENKADENEIYLYQQIQPDILVFKSEENV